MDIKLLVDWNPWWVSGKVPDELKGIERPLYHHIIGSLALKEISVILGVRRCGKSTILFQAVDHLIKEGVKPSQILFVSLDDNRLNEHSLDDIYSCYRENMNDGEKSYIFLDEIHKKDSWESWIRKKYDLKSKDKFFVSGSCSYLLRREYSTLLTGRNLTFEVFPLSFDEFLLFNDIQLGRKLVLKGVISEKDKIILDKSLIKYLNQGGFPEIALSKDTLKNKVIEQYFDDIIYKDIIDRYNLNSHKVRDFAIMLMTNFTRQMSLRAVRGSLGLSYDSIKDYLSYFKESYMFFSIDHFSYSFKEQKTLPSKVYCIDNGLRNSVSFKFSKDEGKLAENLVFLELRKRHKDIYYWAGKNELDFVVKGKDNALVGINVSFTDDIDEREIKAMVEFKRTFNKTTDLIMITKNIEKKDKGISYIPLWKWLLEI